MALTEEQKKDYLEKNGIRCPYCNSEDIEAGFMEIDGGDAWQKVKCNNCDKSWRDVYELKAIEEEEEG